MEFSLIYDPVCKKDFSKLPKQITSRIHSRLHRSKKDPLYFWKKNTNRGDYKIRIGEYRALADIDFELRRIEVTKIGHRKNIYKR